MRKVPFVLLGLLVLAAGCSSGLKNEILGKWEPQDEGLKGKGVVAELNTSEVKMRGPTGIELVSPYRFVGDDTIEVETTMFGKKSKHQYKVVVNGDEMTLAEPKGPTKKFKRIK